jgi:hypothetical protein
LAWSAYQLDPSNPEEQRRAAIEWCRRALAVDPTRADVAELLRRAEASE